MIVLACQTAGPNWLELFRKRMGTLGVAKKIENIIFSNRFIQHFPSKFHWQGKALNS